VGGGKRYLKRNAQSAHDWPKKEQPEKVIPKRADGGASIQDEPGRKEREVRAEGQKQTPVH